jgi:Skp family chaperone for outer membrane proteins
MKKYNFIILVFLTSFFFQKLSAELPYYLDFKFILNESNAGKKAQTELKQKLSNGLKSINDREKKIQEEEKKIISQKKLISAEEYKKKVTDLRSKVLKLQKDRNNLVEKVAKQRSRAREVSYTCGSKLRHNKRYN